MIFYIIFYDIYQFPQIFFILLKQENINTLGNEIATMAGGGGKHKPKH